MSKEDHSNQIIAVLTNHIHVILQTLTEVKTLLQLKPLLQRKF